MKIIKKKIGQIKNKKIYSIELINDNNFRLKFLNFGCYIRWIPLKDPDKIKLTNGGIIIDIDIINDCVQIKVKNNMNRIFQIKFDECYIFQKLTNQENIILGVLDYLEK